MKKINSFLFSLIAVLVVALSASCGESESQAVKNVFEKKADAYEKAAVKVAEAKEVSVLNEINKALEDELAGIEEECAAELKSVDEKKAVDADAFKSDEEALKAAQKAYDDAFVGKFLNLSGQ